MKPAYRLAPLAILTIFLSRLYPQKALPPGHAKILNSAHRVIAMKSNSENRWYVLPAYRWILSAHTLERLLRKESLWSYWRGSARKDFSKR